MCVVNVALGDQSPVDVNFHVCLGPVLGVCHVVLSCEVIFLAGAERYRLSKVDVEVRICSFIVDVEGIGRLVAGGPDAV